jgi:hypothetical protein
MSGLAGICSLAYAAQARSRRWDREPERTSVRFNRRQVIVVYVTLAVIVVMLLFPPFVSVHPRLGTSFSGYGFIATNDDEVDVARLALQCIAAIVAAAGLVFGFRDRAWPVSRPS